MDRPIRKRTAAAWPTELAGPRRCSCAASTPNSPASPCAAGGTPARALRRGVVRSLAHGGQAYLDAVAAEQAALAKAEQDYPRGNPAGGQARAHPAAGAAAGCRLAAAGEGRLRPATCGPGQGAGRTSGGTGIAAQRHALQPQGDDRESRQKLAQITSTYRSQLNERARRGGGAAPQS